MRPSLLSLIILVVMALIFLYLASGSMEAFEDKPYGETNSRGTFTLYYADWCPHCKTAKPIWNDLKTQYQNKTINGYQVLFTEINCTTENAETEQMMNKYNIEGFPTIKLIKDGQIIEYDAKPTKDTLNEFLNTVL